ncbi:hypothetical protein MCUN1_002553 [Malassezia cuniculi]|uniref:Ribosomal RNA-processing protein 42 n=1 Tax=Malassezia cuniculi TaxID=948313 RepID=A0AAF0EZP7_9BASI|nr:hypothetical protein MCUN1_002553 [Malassezia cuniculi]
MSLTLSHAERTYITAGIASKNPQRLDSRRLDQFRNIEIDAPASLQADGSARVRIGSTEILCGVKAEMDPQTPPRVTASDGSTSIAYSPWLPNTPRIKCAVEYSPALVQTHNTHDQGVLTASLTDLLSACFVQNGSHIGPFPASQFIVLPNARYWLLHVDVYIMSWSGGNVLDTLFAAVFAALWRTRLPRTEVLAYEAPAATQDMVDADSDPLGMKFITRGKRTNAPAVSTSAVDFALADEWDDGMLLEGREELPVCVTIFPLAGEQHLLDASYEEEQALSSSVNVIASATGRLYAVRQNGKHSLEPEKLYSAIETGVQYAKQLAEMLKQ